jgi:hypothetical protein
MYGTKLWRFKLHQLLHIALFWVSEGCCYTVDCFVATNVQQVAKNEFRLPAFPPLNVIALDVIALDVMALDGIALDVIALDVIALDVVPLDGVQSLSMSTRGVALREL